MDRSRRGLRHHRGGQFTIQASLGDSKPSIRGSVTYQPTDLDPATSGGETPGGEGSGTAFAVTQAGILVTCAHVIRGATEIHAHLGPQKYAAKVIAYDSQRDLALLKIDASNLPCLPVADSNQIQLGQDVRVVGFPLSDVLGESIKITRGTIAGIVDRKDGRLFQIDASVNPGNSGGPLVDAQSRMRPVAPTELPLQAKPPVSRGLRRLATSCRRWRG